MPDIFENTEGLKFSRKLVNGKYEVLVPSFMDVHDWWGDWETARFNSMEALLKPGMILFDVGAFDGWQSVILSRFVGAKNMVLIEPVAENWPNIKSTWEANRLTASSALMEHPIQPLAEFPLATYMGFIGPETKNLPSVNNHLWPAGPDYSKAIAVTKFQHLNENGDTRPCFSLDNLRRLTTTPDAINIDVEGAELIVLKSAIDTLLMWSPLVWISVHPQFMRERYGHEPEDVDKLLHALGYKGEFLGEDHELHFLYRKVSF